MEQEYPRTIVTRLRQAVDALEHQVDSAGGRVNDRVMMAITAAQANLRDAIEQMSLITEQQSVLEEDGLTETGSSQASEG